MARKKIKDIREELLSKNLPISYLKQPLEFTFLKNNLSLNQINFIIEIINLLQDKIKIALAKGKQDNGNYPSLFSEEELLENSLIPLELRLSQLNISTHRYEDVEEAVLQLMNMKFVYNTTDENGEQRTQYQVLFPYIDIPSKAIEGWNTSDGEQIYRRSGVIKIKMMYSTANALFSMNQYTQYLKMITESFSSAYSLRLYMCLAHYNNPQHGYRWIVEYNTLRRILGVSEYFICKKNEYYDNRGVNCTDKIKDEDIEERTDKGVWVRTKYPLYANFRQRILSYAKDEFNELEKNNGIDINFSVEEQRPNGVSRGTPNKIIFTIHKTNVGELVKARNAEINFRNDWKRRLINEYNLSAPKSETLSKKIKVSNEHIVYEAIARVMSEAKSGKRISSIPSYLFTSINNAIEEYELQQIPIAEEVSEPVTPAIEIAKEDMDLFKSLIQDAREWGSAMKLEEVTNDIVVIRMPSPITYDTFIKGYNGKDFFDKISKTFERKVKVIYN